MNRTRPTLMLCVALLFTPATQAEESLEAVLSGYYEAIGGLDAWQAVESLRMNGHMAPPTGMEAPFVMTFERPMKTKLEFSLQGMTAVQVYDGQSAWAIMPFMGSTDPEVMPEEQTKMMREQADVDGPLVDWERKGHQIELVGKTAVDGIDAYHLVVTLDTGAVRHFFLDSQSYLPTRLEATTSVQGTEMEIETIFDDYKEVGGLIMAHSIESKPKGAPSGQVLTIDSIELDLELAADFFDMPTAEKDEEEEEEGEAAE